MSIFLTLMAVSFVVFIHELGHMLLALRAGVGVYEFAVGMGPKIVSTTYKGILFSFRLLPIGGFVKLAGMDEDAHEAKVDPKDDFNNKSIWARMSVIVAGPLFNILLGFVAFFFMFWIVGTPVAISEFSQVFPDTPAARAGIQPGDAVVLVNGEPVDDVYEDFVSVVNRSIGSSVHLVLQRMGESIEFDIIPEPSSQNKDMGVIGVRLADRNEREGVLTSAIDALKSTFNSAKGVFLSLKWLITGKARFADVAGPVGLIQFASFSLERGAYQFFSLMAMISISLGVINLFPFPVLDGGHLLLLLIEWIRGKRLNERVEAIITNVATVVLISLMALILVNDVLHLEYRSELLNKISIKKP